MGNEIKEPKETIVERVGIREPKLKEQLELVSEYTETAIDRIKLYAGLAEFPEAFNSIAVDVVLAMYRRKYHEGITSEGVDVMSVTFVNGLLSEYDREFSNYKKTLDQEDDSQNGKLVFM
ncbi:phage head-tail connector protein [Enterococcus avium]|uniref:phage head-tail connector protein n=1 Tax=Enterococcus avium TaxID=33945 RepID=UPI002890D0FA|nr:phage head-tail connector protein [Enterococcus avium]MDT2383543.1 phage head-tail connector protein [Enterococcus avium]